MFVSIQLYFNKILNDDYIYGLIATSNIPDFPYICYKYIYLGLLLVFQSKIK